MADDLSNRRPRRDEGRDNVGLSAKSGHSSKHRVGARQKLVRKLKAELLGSGQIHH